MFLSHYYFITFSNHNTTSTTKQSLIKLYPCALLEEFRRGFSFLGAAQSPKSTLDCIWTPFDSYINLGLQEEVILRANPCPLQHWVGFRIPPDDSTWVGLEGASAEGGLMPP
jgi:hypothetical protein